MGCCITKDSIGTVIHLVDELNEDDFDRIQMGFEQAVDNGAVYVILDFDQLEIVTSSVTALIGMLRLQSRRKGTALELRNVTTHHMKITDRQPRIVASADQ